MSLRNNLRTYWPWWVALSFLGVYELVALAGPAPTLSALVWQASANNPWLDVIVIVVSLVLLVHFFFFMPPKAK
ncbi:MAG TPA: hypothetical protein VM118_11620 [Acidobacteriota bacterium]|nr:hypothetical protein [Acidobacteriota bacterium]